MSNRITGEELKNIETGKDTVKQYSTGEITVYWHPAKCIHSANCITGLSRVFNTQKKPWININGASSEEIIKTIDTCPSRALLYLEKDQTAGVPEKSTPPSSDAALIQILKDGPVLISGNFILKDSNHQRIPIQSEVVAICRCGASLKKPFCDGSHKKVGFRD